MEAAVGQAWAWYFLDMHLFGTDKFAHPIAGLMFPFTRVWLPSKAAPELSNALYGHYCSYEKSKILLFLEFLQW